MKYDFTVVGGGLSGIAAAVCAAREGLKVLLVEKGGCLGGAMFNNLVYPFMKSWTRDPKTNEKYHLSAGIFSEMKQRFEKYCPDTTVSSYSPEYYKLVFDDMVREADVDVLFHARAVSVSHADEKIKSVELITPSGTMHVEADFFCDATGNGDLFALAECDFMLGRDSDGLCQPMTNCFRMSGVDVEQFKKDFEMLNRKYTEYQKDGRITNPRENLLVFYGIGEGIVHFNTTRVIKLDPTDPFDISRAEMTARAQIYELDKFLRENSSAFKNSTIISVANEIGVRESRKLKGVYVLTQEDLKALTVFEDSIALGNYDIDIHNPNGGDTSHYYFKNGDYYTIPYRSLLPKEYKNLIVAGRCISATHEAQASIRILPICACLGQAAGTAAAIAYKSDTDLHGLSIPALRETLRKNGAEC
ncbi:MAG: FAD-dependent oxidoreductase [Clostridia bacterium]|nr:FAD-dependent oxidoreductase [Clostridia bacterium]